MAAKSDTTKYYSNLQETKVAEYLGFKKVSGSGARDFHPGDVEGDEWLVECKTHMKRHKVEFNLSVWEKILKEATSKFKNAVYISDDGSQWVDNNWCLVHLSKVVDLDIVSIRPIPFKLLKNKISFETYELIQAEKSIYTPVAWNAKLGDHEVAIMSIRTFKRLFIEKEI